MADRVEHTAAQADLLDFDRLDALAERCRESFANADPFPHIVIEDLVDPQALAAVADEYEATGDGWDHYHHYNEKKVALTKLDAFGPRVRALVEALHSPRFLGFVERLTGIQGLVPDPQLDGAGLHKSLPGGFLNLHTDFLAHPTEPHWSRQINLLLYLNRRWESEWNGNLELWDADVKRCAASIAPLFNRCVIFHTTATSYHGHPAPLACPEGQMRRSLALYYFRVEAEEQRVSSTYYRATPEDSAVRRALIALDRAALRAYSVIKRKTGISNSTITRLLRRF
jgi:Rps23 Pro-64 3,4-dihydroxylase Tpa1-like proline 4-hydroxylase